MPTTTLTYDVPAPVAFAYLVDPRNRPEWQSSLRGVDLVDDGPPRVGQRWRDRTVAGLVPDMVTTVLEPDVLWAETGTWRAFSADLTLRFRPLGEARCEVEATFEVRAAGPLRPLGWAASLGGLPAVRADLRKAGRLLAARRS